ncbi:thiamine biosynthesis protein [Dermabacter sp. HMSC06F07]|uniref:HesA/MoeB/ThiF family protein n=1 Tax=Dermabacter TaxID=36739 RepID=UPI0008A5D387|nr:HesA/MoeB/ThiF family protein [Dermabacter sp. HMSC06F07]MCT1708933.1 ThiF family adenylyltransferase [Dermabacter hominis]OFT47488.1 thiamine biosynthesis protein [Dermabacter sp. HMSC06F07]
MVNYAPGASGSALSGADYRRYSRHLLLPGFTPESQQRLRSAKVAVVGAGGLGAPILQYLAAAGVGSLTVIDADLVDSSNLQRQVIHSEAAVGTPKVSSAAKAVHALNHAVHVREIPEVLTPANALDILAGHDLVLDGTDNFPTRYLVSDACEILNMPLIWGSILAFDGQVAAFFSDDGRGVTYRDVHPRPPQPGEVPSCSEAGVLGPLVGVIGSTMAMEALKILTGLGSPLYGRLQLYSALTGEWTRIDVERKPGRLPVTEIEDLVETCGFPTMTAPPFASATGAGFTSTDGEADEAEANDADYSSAAPTSNLDPEVLSPSEALREAADGRLLIDIREESEAAKGMLPHAVNIPKDQLMEFARGERASVGPLSGVDDLRGAILHCAGGARSAAAQAELAALGIEVGDMAGGYVAASLGG